MYMLIYKIIVKDSTSHIDYWTIRQRVIFLGLQKQLNGFFLTEITSTIYPSHIGHRQL